MNWRAVENLVVKIWCAFFIRITDKWNNLLKEIAEAENLNIFKNRLRRHLIDFSTEY